MLTVPCTLTVALSPAWMVLQLATLGPSSEHFVGGNGVGGWAVEEVVVGGWAVEGIVVGVSFLADEELSALVGAAGGGVMPLSRIAYAASPPRVTKHAIAKMKMRLLFRSRVLSC